MLSSIELKRIIEEDYIAIQWATYLKELEIMGSRSSRPIKVSSSLQEAIDAEFTIIDKEEKEVKLIDYKELKEDK